MPEKLRIVHQLAARRRSLLVNSTKTRRRKSSTGRSRKKIKFASPLHEELFNKMPPKMLKWLKEK